MSNDLNDHITKGIYVCMDDGNMYWVISCKYICTYIILKNDASIYKL